MENKKTCQTSNSPLPAIPMVYRRGDPHHRYTFFIYYKLKKISTFLVKKMIKKYKKLSKKSMLLFFSDWLTIGDNFLRMVYIVLKKLNALKGISERNSENACKIKGFHGLLLNACKRGLKGV